MKNFLKIHDGYDPIPLLAAIARRPGIWREDTYLRDYPQGPFSQIESIMLRFPEKSVSELEWNERVDRHECVDYPPFKDLPEVRGVIFWLMARVQGERLGRCMINKIAPGGRIYPHADTPEHCDYYSRHHVVLQSAPGNNFRCGDETLHLKTGEVWWFNNALEHEVTNNSAVDRIHLIVDIRCSK